MRLALALHQPALALRAAAFPACQSFPLKPRPDLSAPVPSFPHPACQIGDEEGAAEARRMLNEGKLQQRLSQVGASCSGWEATA